MERLPGEGFDDREVPVDVGAHETRRVRGELRPSTVDEVIDIVRSGGPIYPVSTGRNWGMGSRSPVVDDSVVVDLSALDRICSLDLDAGVAVVEPGCAQRKLADALAGTGWMLNVTSGPLRSPAPVMKQALGAGGGAVEQ